MSRDESQDETSFSSSIERSVGAADATLQQLATAKETFGDLEAAYRNFKHELEVVKNEHAAQVSQLQSRIESLLKTKAALEEQVNDTKNECKKHRQELVTTKRMLAERDWEKENLAHEVMSNKSAVSVMRQEREELEREFNNLKNEMLSTSAAVVASDTTDDGEQLLLARQEASHWEEKYNFAARENERLQIDLQALQDKMAALQADYEKSQREILNSNKTNSIKVSKLEMQLQTIAKQKESLNMRLEESRDELRKTKGSLSVSQKDLVETQRQADRFKEHLNARVHKLEKLEIVNKELVSKVEDMKEQLSKQRISTEMHANHRQVIEKEMNESQTRISELETSLFSACDERDNTKRELSTMCSKLTTVTESYQTSIEKVKHLEIQNSSLQNSITALESELFEQKSKCSQMEPSYHQAKEQLKELTLKLEKTLTQMRQVESDYEEAVRERDDYKEELGLSERKISETKTLLQRTEESSNELEQKMAVMKSQMLKVEGQMESASKQKSNFKAELEKEKAKVAKLKKELAKIQSRYNEYERTAEWNKRDYNNKEKTIEELKASVSSSEEKMESLFDQVNKLEAQLEVAEEEKKEVQEKAIAAQKAMREMEADNRLSSSENERLNLEIQSFYKRLSEVQASYNASEHEKHDFQHQVISAQQKIAKLEAELEECSRQRAAYEVKAQEYASANGAINQETSLVKVQLEEHQRKCNEQYREITEKEALIVQLQGKQDVQTVDLEAFRQENKELKAKCEESETERKALKNQLILKQEECSKANGMYESIFRRKEQLEAELDTLHKRLGSIKSDIKLSVVAENCRELTYEKEKSTELSRELASYKSKLSSLESQTAITKNDIHGVLNELEEAQDRISILKQELDEITADRNEQRQRLRFLEERNVELEREILSSKQIKENAEQELHIMRMRNTKYESQVDAIQKQKTTLKDQLDEANSKLIGDKELVMRLESKVTEETKINETMNKVMFRKDQFVDELQTKIRSADAEVNKLRNELMSFKVTTEGMRAEKREYEERIALSRERSEQQETEIFALRESITAMEQELSETKFKTASLGTQLLNLQRDKDHGHFELESAKANARKMREELKLCQDQLKERNKAVDSFTKELKEKENVLERTLKEKITLKTEVMVLSHDLESMKSSYEKSQSRASELEYSLDEANASISRLDMTIGSLHSESEKLEQSRESCDAKVFQVDALFKESQEREGALKLKIEGYKNKVTILETDCRTSEQRNMELDHENNVLKRKLQECEMSFERYEQEKKNLKEELLSLHGKVSDLEVKYEYECREKDSISRQLEDVSQRVTSSRQEFLKNSQQIVEQRLGAEVMRKEMDEKVDLIDQLKADKHYLEENFEILKSTLTASREDCERTKLEKGRLQQEILTLTASNDEYEKRMQTVIQKRDRIRSEYQSHLAEVSYLEQQISEQRREKEALCGQIEDWKNTALQYEDNGVNAERKIAELHAAVDSLRTDTKKKDELIENLKGSNLSLEQETDLLRKRFKKLEEEFGALAVKRKDDEFQTKYLVNISSRVDSSAQAQNLENDVTIQRRKVIELEINNRASLEKVKELEKSFADARVDASRWESQFKVTLKRKEELELEIQTLTEELKFLKEQHRSLADNLEANHWKLQEALNKISQQEIQIDNENKFRARLENQLHESDVKLKKSDGELLMVQRELQENQLLREQQSKTNGGNDSLVKQLKEENHKMKKEAFMLQQELNTTHSLLSAARREKDKVDQEIFHLKRNITEVEAKKNASELEIKELNSDIASYYKTRNSNEEQRKALFEQATLKSQLDEANDKGMRAKDEICELQREALTLRALVEQGNKILMERESFIKEQHSKIKHLEEELESSKQKIVGRSDEYDKEHKEVRKLQLQLQEKGRSFSETEGALRVLHQENNKLKQELADCQASEFSLKQGYHDSQVEMTRLREEIVSRQQTISFLETQSSANEEEKCRHRKELLISEKTNAELRSKLDLFESERRNLQNEIHMTKVNDNYALKTHSQSMKSNDEKRGLIGNKVLDAGWRDGNVLREKEEYEREISLLRDRVLHLESKWTELSKEKGKLQYDVEWRERKIEDLESRMLKEKERDKEANIWQLQTSKLEHELVVCKDKIAGLETDLVSYREKLLLSEQKASLMESESVEVQNRPTRQEATRTCNETQNKNLALVKEELQWQLKEEAQLKRIIEEVKCRNFSLRGDLSKIPFEIREDNKKETPAAEQWKITEFKNDASVKLDESTEGFRKQISDQNIMVDNLRSETSRLQCEIQTMKRELTEMDLLKKRSAVESERFKEKATTLCAVLAERNKENGNLKDKLCQVCKERDFLLNEKRTLEIDLSISVKKMIEAEKHAITESSKKEQELVTTQKRFNELETEYNEVKRENETLKLEMDFRIKNEVCNKQECIYELEKEMRTLKSENEYHQKMMEEKNASLSTLKLQILSWQKEVERIEKELFVSQEAYSKCELRMREIFSNGHNTRFTVADLRSFVSATPAIKEMNFSGCEFSITDRTLTDDTVLNYPSFVGNVTPIRGVMARMSEEDVRR